MSENRSIAFLHTAGVHSGTFADLMQNLAPDMFVHHFVDETLLADAMAQGRVDDDVAQRIAGRLHEAADTGADLIVCTCSTIGGAAEQAGAAAGLPVIRIDRAMAERAIDLGRRVLVAACIDSTIAPTSELLKDVAREKSKELELSTIVIEGAWNKFESGDLDGYHATIAEGLRRLADQADVVVLAQASMAPAAARCRDLPMEILSSPELGVRQAVDTVSAASRASEKT